MADGMDIGTAINAVGMELSANRRNLPSGNYTIFGTADYATLHYNAEKGIVQGNNLVPNKYPGDIAGIDAILALPETVGLTVISCGIVRILQQNGGFTFERGNPTHYTRNERTYHVI